MLGMSDNSTETPKPDDILEDDGRSRKKLIAGGALGAVIIGIVIMNLTGRQPQPEIVVIDTVKPTLEVGAVEIYDNTYIDDFREQMSDETDKIFEALRSPDALSPSHGSRPEWLGRQGISWDAVPSTGRLLIAGGAVFADDTPREAAASFDIEVGDVTAGDEGSEGGGIGGRLTGGLKSLTGGGMVSGLVIDQATGAATKRFEGIAGAIKGDGE